MEKVQDKVSLTHLSLLYLKACKIHTINNSFLHVGTMSMIWTRDGYVTRYKKIIRINSAKTLNKKIDDFEKLSFDPRQALETTRDIKGSYVIGNNLNGNIMSKRIILCFSRHIAFQYSVVIVGTCLHSWLKRCKQPRPLLKSPRLVRAKSFQQCSRLLESLNLKA